MTAGADRAAGPLLEALSGVFRQIADPVVVLRAILDQAVALTGATRGLIVEVEAAGDFAFRVLHGLEPRHLEGQAGLFSRQIFQRAIETREMVHLDNALDDPFYGAVESVQALRVRAILCAPIPADGRIAALIHLEAPAIGHFTAAHRDLIATLVGIAGPVLAALHAGREVMGERDRLQATERQLRDEAEESRRQLAAAWSFGRFIGASPPVRELEATVRKAAATDFPVLVTGETGTGKGIIARVLHYAGPRSRGPLVTVFCPSLERGMVEAELFGHRRGAFTGAVTDRIGKVQAADHGTLFLDEIGELPLEIQPKLLRLLQERTYERVGDTAEQKADVRVLAATHRDLEEDVREGRFRRDLYERLRFIPIRVPPLRERLEDLGPLLRHCLDQTDTGRWISLAPEARAYLERLEFSWPGNVRHVEQLAARLTMEGFREPVTAAQVARLLGAEERPEGTGRAPVELEAGLPRLLEEAERRWLDEALRRYAHLTRAEMATRLKISESALYKKLKQHGLGE